MSKHFWFITRQTSGCEPRAGKHSVLSLYVETIRGDKLGGKRVHKVSVFVCLNRPAHETESAGTNAAGPGLN